MVFKMSSDSPCCVPNFIRIGGAAVRAPAAGPAASAALNSKKSLRRISILLVADSLYCMLTATCRSARQGPPAFDPRDRELSAGRDSTHHPGAIALSWLPRFLSPAPLPALKLRPSQNRQRLPVKFPPSPSISLTRS